MTGNGVFDLVDLWFEDSNNRSVLKFETNYSEAAETEESNTKDLEHNRIISSQVKQSMWQRDRGQCVRCGVKDNLHYDHVIPLVNY